jgi:hypothetical protein
LKPRSIQPNLYALLLALLWLLAACGTTTTGSIPPTPTPAVPATVAAAPTQPIQATAAAPTTGVSTQPAQATIAAPTTSAPTADTPTAATSQAAAATILISYHKSGGIAGINETFTIYTDGTTELRDKGGTARTQADPNAIAALQKLLASPELAALQMPVQPPVPDQFVYELTLPSQRKPLVVTDTADNPPIIRELIDMLEQLKMQAR